MNGNGKKKTEIPKSLQTTRRKGSHVRKGPSATKTLTALLKTPSNRACADCRSALIDPSEVHASFCPSGKDIQLTPNIAVAFHDFQLTHHAFAPPNVKDDPIRFGADPAMFVNQRFGGHGVFICGKCAKAHKRLGQSITLVHPIQDSTVWTSEQAEFMKDNGGNARSWAVYEEYMPEGWKNRRPTPASDFTERFVFCRAKYEALAFAMPPPGPLSELAWISILDRKYANKRFANGDLRKIHNLTPNHVNNPSNKMHLDTPTSENVLPNRLIDFFCVANCSMQLHPNYLGKDLSSLSTPEELLFLPQVCSCFPERTAYDDMEFPEHLPSFVLPDGCHPGATQKPPTFFTFVLTLGDGNRVYGGALQIYDESIEIEKLRDTIVSSGYDGELPQFLKEEIEGGSDIIFLPKCLIVLSHHPFFDLFREVLQQLYRITFVEAPLPIERYISNIVSEVPLPPQGKIKVEFGFTADKIISIQRPGINKLPMANFSYRPLFASLSVGNIMVVLGCLMQECKVALMSQYFSILCPVAEALMSALFPFEWQGLYIPVLPTSMMDILDAPVPFLLGMDSRYFYSLDTTRRPSGVVFVDLDRDVIHLGIDEVTGDKRSIPSLPSRDAMKLLSALEVAGGSVYLIPNNGIKGCIMDGSKESSPVMNEERPNYSQMASVVLESEALGRKEVFSNAEKAFDGGAPTEQYSEFQTECGQIKDDYDSDSESSREGGLKFTRMKRPIFLRNKKATDTLSEDKNAREQGHLLDMTEPDGFSSADVRNAFLRFIVTVFVNYERFLLTDSGRHLFDEEKFLDSQNLDIESRSFLQRVLESQMFQRFLEERNEAPEDPEIRFFDESIIAKHNRSKATTLTTGGKKKTPFLDDESWKVTKTFTPPPPSNKGLSTDATYSYETFPELDFSKAGPLRPPMKWARQYTRSRDSARFKSTRIGNVRKTQQEIVKKAMGPFMNAPGAVAAATRRSVRDLEAALSVMSLSTTNGQTDSMRSGVSSKAQGSGSHVGTDRVVSTLSRADTIIMNARRKQSILLDLVIKLQAVCRMYFPRLRFIKFRRSIVVLQMKQKKLILTPRVEENTNFFKLQVRRATTIQCCVRRFLALSEARRRHKAIQMIQKHLRGYLAFQRFKRVRNSVMFIQKIIKARKARFVFHLVLDLLSHVQARVRGILVRKQFELLYQQRMTLYREQIFLLWHMANVPLSLRTKLWPTISSGKGSSRLRLAESELNRVWESLGMTLDANIQNCNNETTRLADLLGLDNGTYCKCLTSAKLVRGNQVSGASSPQIQKAWEAVEAERLQVYERLDSSRLLTDIEGIYNDFDIPRNEKMKKVSLAKSIWTNYKCAEKSTSTMMLIFPELESSFNIGFHNPSTKGCRRFPNAQKVMSLPVEKALWDKISLESKIKKHVQEVASIYITKVPSLMKRLEEAEEKKRLNWNSQRAASMKAYGTSTWEECRRKMIQDYVAIPFCYERPAKETTSEL